MHKKSLIAAGLSGLVLLVPGTAFATNGYFSHGFGVRSQGVAGIAIALPQDALAAAANPAGTVLVGDRIDFGVTLFAPDRSADIVGSPVPGADGHYSGNGESNFLIPEFGYTRQLNASIAIGVAVYANGGMNTDYRRNPFGSFVASTDRAGVSLEQLFISPSAAWKLNERHALGAALNIAYQRFEARGLSNFAPFSANPGNISNQGKDSSTGVGLRLGWIGRISPDITLGATWSSRIDAGKFDKYKGLFADAGSFDIPENFGLGLAYAVSPGLTLAVEAEEIKYGDIESIAHPLANIAPGNLGSSRGAGFGWKDVTVTRIGAVYEYSKTLTLRAGYSHSDQPFPASETFFNILAPAVVQDHLTFGVTWTTASGGELSLSYAHAFQNDVKGAASLVGFGGGEVNLRMKQDVFGIAYGWKL